MAADPRPAELGSGGAGRVLCHLVSRRQNGRGPAAGRAGLGRWRTGPLPFGGPAWRAGPKGPAFRFGGPQRVRVMRRTGGGAVASPPPLDIEPRPASSGRVGSGGGSSSREGTPGPATQEIVRSSDSSLIVTSYGDTS